MNSAFSPTVTSDDLRTGTIIVTAVDDDPAKGCEITVSFPIEPGDRQGDDLALALGRWRLDFNYEVVGWPHAMIMNDLVKAIGQLHTIYEARFANSGPAFVDAEGACDTDMLRAALGPLADLGFGIYWRLFGLKAKTKGYSWEYIDADDVDLYGRLLRRWLDSAPDVHITAPRHLVPWNILCPKNAKGLASALEFWGLGKNLELVCPGISQRVQLDPAWRIVAGLERLDEDIVPATERHDLPTHPLVLHETRVTPVDCPKVLFESFAHADILYHFGHASSSARGFEFGQISLNGIDFSAFELDGMLRSGQMAVPARRPLLVFLNGCSTATGSGTDETIPGVLVNHATSKLCFLVTIGAVPAWPAAEFARHFFDAYCSGGACSLGKSLSQARRKMLEELGSPVGLLYAAWGRLSTVIVDTAAPRALMKSTERVGAY